MMYMKRINSFICFSFFAAMLFLLGNVSVSAQYYMNVVKKSGVKVQFLISDIDSVFFDKADTSSNNYKAVDLGLSVKWAICNIGAEKPEDYGDYYAWGEIENKNEFTSTNYKWYDGSTLTIIKYGGDSDSLFLFLEDDVAHIKWGCNWRMPTKTEFQELRTNCTWVWSIVNGVNGFLITSNKEGYKDCSIFLPAAGSFGCSPGEYGSYWSSSLCEDFPFYAWHFNFQSKSSYLGGDSRYDGRSVRPVCP